MNFPKLHAHVPVDLLNFMFVTNIMCITEISMNMQKNKKKLQTLLLHNYIDFLFFFVIKLF